MTTEIQHPNIIIGVDDQALQRHFLERSMKVIANHFPDIVVLVVASYEAAAELIELHAGNIIGMITDMKLHDHDENRDGVELSKILANVAPDAFCYLLTALAEDEVKKDGPYKHAEKGNVAKLMQAILAQIKEQRGVTTPASSKTDGNTTSHISKQRPVEQIKPAPRLRIVG